MIEWQLYAELRRGAACGDLVDIALPSKTECICRSLLLKEVGIKETPKISRTSRTFHVNVSEGGLCYFQRGLSFGPQALPEPPETSSWRSNAPFNREVIVAIEVLYCIRLS